MPLKLSHFDAPNVAVLNKWAAGHENTIQSHTTQLTNLSTLLDRLFKENPTLVKPTDK